MQLLAIVVNLKNSYSVCLIYNPTQRPVMYLEWPSWRAPELDESSKKNDVNIGI